MNGWIKLHRSTLDHWVSQEPELLTTWIRLLMEANHAETKRLFNGTLTTVKRGQLIFGLESFAQQANISISKLRRHVRLLEDDSMISRQKTNKYSIISITNYDFYQGDDRQDDKQNTGKSQANDKQTTSKPQHRKNVKNDNNEKNGKNGVKFIKPSLDEIKTFISEKKYLVNADTFFNYYESNGWKVGKNSMKSWQSALATWNAKEKQPVGNNQPHYKVFGQ